MINKPLANSAVKLTLKQIDLRKETELVNGILKYNAELLDSLYRMTFCELDKAQVDLLTTQLNKTGDYIIVYLARIANCVQKYRKKTK